MNNHSIPEENWKSPKIEIRNSNVEGKGMFAISNIAKGEKIGVWGGKWGKDYVDEKGVEEAKRADKLVMQWDENLYSVEDRGEDEGYFINHSCDPNVWMSDAFTLIARSDIKKGEELTADYALWEADVNYVSKWECNCGSILCRQRVTGKDWRNPDLQKRYKGHFSPLVNKRITNLSG